MDLEEWEILPHSGFLDYRDDGEKQNIGATKNCSNFNMNYFVCPSSPPRNSRIVPNQLVPVPFQLEPKTVKDQEDMESKEPTRLPFVIMPEKIKDPDLASKEADQDPISQVFFKKMRENEFVDMKILERPTSPTSKGSFVPPQIETAGKFNFEDKSDAYKSETFESAKITSPRIKNSENDNITEEEVNWEENSGGLNIWKWSLNGIGAICSFGVAAATVCIIIFGSQQRNKQHQQNQKRRFQIYTDDKRIKQVVHHATRLNEAITTVRGVPIARAHITYGGYFDAL
ncbi:hypothetical protein JCGZ_02715 [Jatropha curcas]|uniref:DUF6821 domain-containing protein n=1 Tax=Jatropha curcas TaxID=180498 RepID=A0A067L5D2_JATCU|nr:uncharacterized protein LOC105632622 [Jatropha curcas]KDP39695.1 hypothetical protein JCGZ_02715 [Jatropha curcas]